MNPEAYDRLFEIEVKMWWYRERRAVCTRLLDCALPGPGGVRVLDVGCGTGFNMKLLGRYGAVEGVDPAPEALAYCRRRGVEHVRQGGAESLPFPDRRFQLVTAFDIIEHVDDDVGALAEFARVLEPEGHLLVYTAALPALDGEQDRAVGHRRRYRKRRLRERLVAAGFEVRNLSHVILIVLPLVLLVRLALSRVRNRPHVEMSMPPAAANALLTLISRVEAPIVTSLGLPIGLSLVALAKRPRPKAHPGEGSP